MAWILSGDLLLHLCQELSGVLAVGAGGKEEFDDYHFAAILAEGQLSAFGEKDRKSGAGRGTSTAARLAARTRARVAIRRRIVRMPSGRSRRFLGGTRSESFFDGSLEVRLLVLEIRVGAAVLFLRSRRYGQ